VALAAISSCGDESPTPAERFDAEHGGITSTPHGKIVEGSAQDQPDGDIEYETEDGSRWEVTPRKNDTYSEPRTIKD
jgi:hypothetical protein